MWGILVGMDRVIHKACFRVEWLFDFIYTEGGFQKSCLAYTPLSSNLRMTPMETIVVRSQDCVDCCKQG